MGAPVNHTCPDINRLIKKANDPIKELWEALKSDDIEDIKSVIRDAIYDLEDIEGIAEELRGDNSSLRNWGDELEGQVKELELTIDDLEDQLKELKK